MLLFTAGCFHRPEKVAVPSFDPPAMASRALAEKDANHDEALSADEVRGWQGLRSVFKSIDKNSNGKLERSELEQHFADYAVGRIGLQSLTCFVYSGGTPVSDATVEFVPEPLFAEYIKPGRATTGRDGSGPVLPTDGGLPGMAPGMYRVTISKKNGDRETIPKKFNSESELGFEVSNALGGAPAKFDIGR